MGKVYLTTRIDSQLWYWTGWSGWSRRKDQAKAYDSSIDAQRARELAVTLSYEEAEAPAE
jgi:hypothetical protein